MASLIEIKKKIQAVTNTSTITKAMQLVAGSKMRGFQKKALSSRAYINDLLEIYRHIPHAGMRNVYTEQRTTGATLFIIYTSDKGLCGSLNTQLIRKLFKSSQWLNTPPEERLLITIGRKSYEYARANKIKIEKHYRAIPEKMTIYHALPIIDDILEYWTSGRCKEIVFLAPHYKNTFLSYPVLKKFLPLSSAVLETNRLEPSEYHNRPKETGYHLYEPGKERVLEVLYTQIIHSLFIQSFFELKAAEYSSRMIAMQNATEAAKKIVQNLKLTFNKTRQQVITQELAELIGGSEAVSS